VLFVVENGNEDVEVRERLAQTATTARHIVDLPSRIP